MKSYRFNFKIVVLVGLATITGFLELSIASGYEEGKTGEAVVEGKITYKGTPPVREVFDLARFANKKYCSQVDSDGKGHRIIREVTVNNGNLQDVVVYIQDIIRGKRFPFNGTDVKIDHCRFLVQGGPSTLVGVVVNGGEIRVLNDDADLDDPKSLTGVLHNPHGLEFRQNGTNFNMIRSWPLPEKGNMVRKQVKFKEPGNVLLLYCQNHSYEQAWYPGKGARSGVHRKSSCKF
jgi:hypothetical protein